MVGSRIIDTVLEFKELSLTEKEQDEYIFLFYRILREDLLPMSYYSSMIEAAMVNGSVFDFLFERLDPESFKILGSTPSNVFQKHFTTLFCEFNSSVAYAVLDLIFAFGSGFMRGTSVSPHMTPVNRDYPLCRTQ